MSTLDDTLDLLARLVGFDTVSAKSNLALIEFVRGGKGFAGIHSATDTFYKWPEYGELIGGYFDGHPWHEEITVRVEDEAHTITSDLGNQFVITDEIYQFKGPYDRTKLHVLMRLDMKGLPAGKRADMDNALAWTNQYGKGRVFYCSLGHVARDFDVPEAKEIVKRGMLWASR